MAEKNKYGQYFTIGLIADFMVSLISRPKDCKVLEPSCGKGVFLDYLVSAGYTNISAYEIDPSLGKRYEFIQFKSFLSVPTSEKYSIIIGNPPYIRWKNLEPELKKELESNALWKRYFNSLCDYLFIFILKSIEHLEENGELIFICTEYWMNTTHSVSLRNYMCQNGYFTEIYHFKEAPLFEKVTASFIIFKFVKSRQKKHSIVLYQYNKERGLPTKTELQTKSCFDLTVIPQFNENSRWLLASENTQSSLNRFEKCCTKSISSNLFTEDIYRIGEFCDIGNGMVSGLDEAFQISDIKNLNGNEEDCLINVLKAKNLSPYVSKDTTKYIFIQKPLNEDLLKSSYPHFAAHLTPFIDKLNKRYNYNRDIPYWEFVFPRNQKLFERPEDRIFIPCKERISNKKFFRFCFAPAGFYPTQDVTAIFRKKTCKESLEYILAYLNNHRVFQWLELNGIVKGAIVEFSETPIASIPFRPIKWEKEDEVLMHEYISKEVKSYIADSQPYHLDNINNSFNILFQ